MRSFFILLRHELKVLRISSATYVAAVVFLLLMAFFYWAIIREMGMTEQTELPATRVFSLFWWPVCFLVPLLTMRSLAEERRQGTLETLMATSAGGVSVVLAKYFAAYLFYLLLWALTLLFPVIAVNVLPGNGLEAILLEPTPLIGGLSFVAVSGLLFIAVGIFTSSLTRSQLVAGMLSFTLLFILFLVGWIASDTNTLQSPLMGWLGTPLDYLHTFQHLDDFTRGVIDTRPFAYYGSFTLLCLGLAVINVEAKA